MSNRIFKDKRRSESYFNESLNEECWNISLKYSQQLYNNIDRPDLYQRCLTCYHQFMNEIHSRKLPYKNKKYIQIWETMVNTSKKRLDRNKQSVKLLHQTNVQRNN
mgnify:CR=1 FL=1